MTEDIRTETGETADTVSKFREIYPRFNENKIKNRRTRVFTLIKRPDACFYYRILNPHQQLTRQFGWECKYQIIDPLPPDLQRGIPNTIEPNDRKGSLRNLVKCHGENLEWADIIIMQRPTCDHHLDLMRYIQKELKKPVVYEADDNYIDVPKWNPGHMYFTPRAEYIKDMIRECDLLTVTTEHLGDIYRTLQRKNIAVCPNSIDFENLDEMPTDMVAYEQKEKRKFFVPMRQMRLGMDDWEPYRDSVTQTIQGEMQRQNVPYDPSMLESYIQSHKDLRFQVPDHVYNEKSNGKTMIMWGGSPTHKEDLNVVTNPLMKIMHGHPDWLLGMVGFIHADWLNMMKREQLWQFGLVPVKYYYSLYKQVGAQVGIAPVNKDAFNLGKSNLKVIEYMALGIYAIASDYATYEGCGPDVPLCSTEEQWEKAIINACEDDELRFEVTQKNRQYVEVNYSMSENVQFWKEAYEKLI